MNSNSRGLFSLVDKGITRHHCRKMNLDKHRLEVGMKIINCLNKVPRNMVDTHNLIPLKPGWWSS